MSLDLRFFLNDNEIEIDTGVILPLTYSVADIKSPEKRSRNRSKTIKVKGTANNLKALSSTYNLSLQASTTGFEFNPNDEITAKIVRNGVIIFNGVANFMETVLSNGVYNFNFQVFGKVVGMFEVLGERTLSELDWSKYDHPLTISNIELSWDTSVLIDGIATSNFLVGNPKGFGYLYGLINFGYAPNQLSPRGNEMIPYFYMIEAFTKCFEILGYTITGNWASDTLTKKITFGLGGGDRIFLSTAEIAARLIKYSYVGSISIDINSFGIYSAILGTNKKKYFSQKNYKISDISPITSTLVNDTRVQFDEALGMVTIGSTGNYNISLIADFNVTTMGFSQPVISSNIFTYFYLIVKKNGSTFSSVANYSSATGTINITANSQSLLMAGDVLEFYVEHKFLWFGEYGYTDPIPNANLDYNLTTASFTVNAIDKALDEGNTVEVGRWMPNIKCRDFINDVILMNNLYFSEPNEDNEIRVETFNDYYGTTANAENYSKRLDYSRSISIKTNAGIEGKNYKFMFAEDRDSYKDMYYQRWGIDYGDLDYKIPTTFKKGNKIYKVGFAQTVPIVDSGIIIPQVVKRDPITNIASPHKGKPRIFIYNGLTTGDWDLRNSTTGAATAQTEYPLMHHIDSITAPTFDLNFGVPVETYYGATVYTTNNIFAEHYEVQIKELTSIDSKLLTAYFKINERNLIGEFMSRLVNVEGVVYRNNVISDYDSTGFETTKHELVKVLEASPRKVITLVGGEATDIPLPIGNYPSNTTTEITTTSTLSRTSNNMIVANSSGGAITITIDPTTIDNNREFTFLRQGANDVTIAPSTGTLSGLSSVVLRNDFDTITITLLDDILVIKNFDSATIGTGAVTTITTDTSTSASIETYVCDMSVGDITLTLMVDAAPIGKTWIVKRQGVLNNLTITNDDPSTWPIDGSSSIPIYGDNISRTFKKTLTGIIVI